MSSPSPTPPAESRRPRSHLREKVRSEAENRPGLYRFLGPRGEVLYVGKSVGVRTRLLSYFQRTAGSKTAELLRTAEGVEWEYLPNEFEALLREFRQIRAFRPRFNVRHRRERRYAWVKLTGGPAPRLVACRRPRRDGGRYFGPFPAPGSLPRILRDLARTIGLRDCPDTVPMRFSDQLDLLSPRLSPACPRAELGSCPGPCAALCSAAEYEGNVRAVTAFLQGQDDAPLSRLRHRVEEAARRRDFEHAALLRDRMDRLERLRQEILEFREFLAGLNFVYRVPSQAAGEPQVGAGVTDGWGYLVVEGRVRLSFPLPSTSGRAGPEDGRSGNLHGLVRAIRRCLGEPSTAPEALSSGEREELFLIVRWFRTRPEERDRTVGTERFLEELSASPPLGPLPSPSPG